MHSGIITVDMSDHFGIFLISKDLMLDSSNKPIHITKPEVNDKFIAYFKTLPKINTYRKFSESCNEFLRFFMVFIMKYFQNKQSK